MGDVILGEAIVWLGALVLWLWPASVRHRLMWALWFWLHPETPIKAEVAPPRIPTLAVAKPNNLLSVEEYKDRYLNPAIGRWNDPSDEMPGKTRLEALNATRSALVSTTTIVLPTITTFSCVPTTTRLWSDA